jgi:hypothetical protein
MCLIFTILIEVLTLSAQAFNQNAWSFTLAITGPGRNMKIEGKLTGKRRLEDIGPCETQPEKYTMFRNGPEFDGYEEPDQCKATEPQDFVEDTLPCETVLDADLEN